MTYIEELGKRAAEASKYLRTASSKDKDAALLAAADLLRRRAADILEANGEDIRRAREASVREAMIDRLSLSMQRIEDIASSMEHIAKLEDPVGEIVSGGVRPNGLIIRKQRTPLGVIGIIYEARPNVTADAAALCLKSGNCCILRGGSEAIRSNMILASLIREALEGCGSPADCVQLVEKTDRETAKELMGLREYLDVLIPRGGAGLIRSVVENARVPVIETGLGNCHVFVDYSADIGMALSIVDNAKTSRPSVCNAMETLLVHRDIAEKFLPELKKVLDGHDVEWRGCEETRRIVGETVKEATDGDYAEEFNDYIMAVKVVGGVEEAVRHIEKYSTRHSEAIITNDRADADYFTKNVDAAAVYVNASTRFTDGGEFGMGAEIGISTQKLHTRGPMGLRELTTVKYVIDGNGQIR